ncbi:uncharacterized protein LOC113120014 isoform X2 [Carassius auratus]|uniref:Uncharacterized protein LOC113120014 isoform X1 n=1 Tax=Carassius auratus TaxID=7957 RepID=A0A6P6RKD5_CARAU|nr:uncharacterized protein LOC113120014 isoform X1 [Carassius auratus]XP_026145604.1 uncharacterized protein LOC113120014 isoform X2 [Carassius auratus]
MKPSRSDKAVSGGQCCMPEQTSELLLSQVYSKRICLPSGWMCTLPPADYRWVSKALFRWSPEMQPEMDYARVDRMWWYPPFPPLTVTEEPEMGCYFGHSLFLWMPQKLWNVKLICPHSDCLKGELTSAGLHQELRQVVDMEGSYFMASERLVCGKCKRKWISWSHDVVSQLDIGHRVQFPCILASQVACDMKVVHFNRLRHLGPSVSQIHKKLEERHTEVWLQKTVRYLTDCRSFAQAPQFQDPPAMPLLPKHCWLRQVFALDVLHRMNEIKASITSTFGSVLKMGSTKECLRNFSGTWVTSVFNEHGQAVMSVLTENKESGLEGMISGVINRYKEAAVAPPEVLYVDGDCCGSNSLRKTFNEWKEVEVRLNISEFMRRISVGCTSESHQIYPTFMDRLTHCIFKWDEEDLKQLKEAKHNELNSDIIQPPNDELMHHLSRSELALHCRRATRDVREIEELITALIRLYDGEAGWDSSGVPLFSSNIMAEMWDSQKKHLPCLVDPLGVPLYEQTGTLVKGGHLLPIYKCFRDSTSIESFHQHLNQLIPEVPACSTFLQIEFLAGLVRWNEATAVASEGPQTPQSCIGVLQQAVNQLGEEVLGNNIVSTISTSKYTCELIGLEYLYHQTGKAIQDSRFIIRQMETTDLQVAKSEGCCKLEDIGDWTITQQPIPSLLEASRSMTSRGALFQEEDLFPPNTSSPAPEKVPFIKEEDNCNDKPLISNLPPDTVMESSNTTQEEASTEQPQSGSMLTLPILFSSPFPLKQMMVVLAHAQKIDAPPTASFHAVPVPHTTQYYQKRKLVKEKDGICTRKYVRRSEAIQCRKCNKERVMSTHRQYFGNWYCEETETKPFAVWKDELIKRGYGKKKC